MLIEVSEFSKDSRINMYINNGFFNGKPIYIHYTSSQGLNAIKMQKRISANPNQERRGGKAKQGVYLTSSKDAMNRNKAHNFLFFCEEKYALSAVNCIIFVFNTHRYLHSSPVTFGSDVTEFISFDDIQFNQITIIYEGKNPFI